MMKTHYLSDTLISITPRERGIQFCPRQRRSLERLRPILDRIVQRDTQRRSTQPGWRWLWAGLQIEEERGFYTATWYVIELPPDAKGFGREEFEHLLAKGVEGFLVVRHAELPDAADL
jgi:hypothetical protein